MLPFALHLVFNLTTVVMPTIDKGDRGLVRCLYAVANGDSRCPLYVLPNSVSNNVVTMVTAGALYVLPNSVSNNVVTLVPQGPGLNVVINTVDTNPPRLPSALHA